jgi:hypothetical protein
MLMILKRPLLWLFASIFSLLLFTTAFNYGLMHTAGNPDKVKKILGDSHIYDNVVSSALAQSKDVSSSQGEISLSDPKIKSAAGQTISPQFVQSSTEKVIDGTFAWLNGKSPQPAFNIDLAPLKAKFASTAAQSAEQQLATLPKCAKGQIPSSFDPLNATCLPPGVTPQAAAAQVQSSILTGQGFLDTPAITADSLKAQGSNQSVFNKQLKTAPSYYQKAKKAPTILAVVTILVALAIIFLSPSKIAGLRKIGITLITIGVIMLVMGWLLKWGVDNKLEPKIKFDNALLQSDIKKLISDLASAITHNYWLFGGIYTALGLAAVLAPKFVGKDASASNDKVLSKDLLPAKAETSEDVAKDPSHKTSPAAKAPEPRARKIQG